MSEVSDARRTFAAALAKFVSPMNVEDGTTAIVTLLTACENIAEAVFNDPIALAQKLGQDLDRVPTYRALHKFLKAESERYIKALPLPYADEEGLSNADRLWIKFWQKHAPGASAAVARNYLGTIRQHAPSAFDVICRDNLDDGDIIAFENEWEPAWRAKQRYVADWKDPERIKTSIHMIRTVPALGAQAALLRFLRTAVEAHAPENAWLLPDLPETAENRVATMPARPLPLAPEQLDAARRIQGIAGPVVPPSIDWGF